MQDGLINLILVAGTPGSGKTEWIRSQFESIRSGSHPLYPAQTPVYFVPLGAEDLPIDGLRLAQGCDSLQVLMEMPEGELAAPAVLYVECSYPIEVHHLPFPDELPIQRIAVLSPDARTEDWQLWADEIRVGLTAPIAPTQLWRLKLSGQILDTASLEIFWQELCGGAYGCVDRAKGIFEVTEGIPVWIEYIRGRTPIVHGQAPLEMIELDFPRTLSGRPDRLSGIEVLGTDLDTAAIVGTLKDCLLSDQQLLAYQAQLRLQCQEEENL